MFYFRNQIKLYTTLVLTSFFGLGVPTVSYATAEQVVPVSAPTAAQMIQVSVVPAQSGASVYVANPTTTSVCTVETHSFLENLQAAVSLNLNQPAQCFSVAVAEPLVQPNLALVYPQSRSLTLATSVAGAVIQPGPQLAASHSAVPPVVLPGYVGEYGSVKASHEFAVAYKQLSLSTTHYVSNSPPLSMLGILRC